MPFHFCPQCGTKLQPDFRFCPSCGEKLPCPSDKFGSLHSTTISRDEAATSVIKTSPASSKNCASIENTVSPRPALRKTRKTLHLEKAVTFNIKSASLDVGPSTQLTRDDKTEDNGGCLVSPLKQHKVTVNADTEELTSECSSPVVKSLRTIRGKTKLSSPAKEHTGGKTEETTVDGASSVSSPTTRSPLKGRNKAKKTKHGPAVEPLQEGEEVADTTGKKWKLTKLLSQSTTELLYEVSRPNFKESGHILKLGAKDGRIFNEQNFLQRAAKPASVDKWIKQNKMDFLGIPPCVGFGLHADSYRFLIFPNIGRSLRSVIEEENNLLPEKVVLQLVCRLLDVLQFIHSNEYVHADINADNIYVKPGQKSQVYLVGYCHAFRYCPGGQHVEYREASRTPHEGAVEFISLDTHKGAAPSRRSDLQSLGYCMLHWLTGKLPWSELPQPGQVAAQKQRINSLGPRIDPGGSWRMLTPFSATVLGKREFQVHLKPI
ncbi:inactive serine/threonine-protein kinase VRK3 isoform X2 [Melanotaenia boesemani]|uniref:inactive serine/threonine-protein kinase VRK3 isoform X2 n=1 Tax=Melanotaenia boesemani TaxID=1250792 RepID=UPI001C05C649|nr:inactive serine/threonine-protein kinase VRK3 isoform X2 [Melanotaenia boesemani]